jgi:hypothetical protein
MNPRSSILKRRRLVKGVLALPTRRRTALVVRTLALLVIAICQMGCSPSTPAVPVVGVLRGLPLPGWVPFPSSPLIRELFVVRYSSSSSSDTLLFRALGYDESGSVSRSLREGIVIDRADRLPWLSDWTPVPEHALSPQATHPMAKLDLAGGRASAITDQEWSAAGTPIFWLMQTGTFRGRSDPRPGKYERHYEWFRRDQVGTTTLDGVTVRGPRSYFGDKRFSPCFRYEAQIWFDNPRFSSRADRFYVIIVDRSTRLPVTPGVLLDAGSLDGSSMEPRWTPDSRYVIMYGRFEGKVWIYPNTAWTPDNGPRPASVGPLPPNLRAPPPSPNIFPL